jgi:hypothetical protein
MWAENTWDGMESGTIFVEAIKTAELSDLLIANINELEILSSVSDEMIFTSITEETLIANIETFSLTAEISEE